MLTFSFDSPPESDPFTSNELHLANRNPHQQMNFLPRSVAAPIASLSDGGLLSESRALHAMLASPFLGELDRIKNEWEMTSAEDLFPTPRCICHVKGNGCKEPILLEIEIT